MNKAELIKKVAERTGKTQLEVKRIVNECFGAIAEAIGKKEKVSIPELGIFNVVFRKQKKARNPKTGKEVIIPSRYSVVFKARRNIREKLKS